ncbi:hypothetical protein BDU57DRAFT_462460 [Ampelomyces quisqualis]|uniref:Mitochondrial inner membrane protein 1 n=1 Tax=Ampelomyces quisqualis TaxID=50730 RepID=A0A6A5Q4X3_AMPQU|nr:hypothetical protein BDU57DRAFT_462460 [Ampelomyces quisqualis]
MLRIGASRIALRSMGAPATRLAPGFLHTSPAVKWTMQFGSLASKRPGAPQLSPMKPIQAAAMRRSITDAQKQAESRYAKEEIKPTPETVSSTSTTNAMSSEARADQPEKKEVDMTAGLKGDLATIRDTFSLSDVPREAYYMGLAGTIPYLATSITTVFCAWETNHSTAGYGYLLDEKNATQLLHLIEPLQIGYGASILSFLGAIHWGLEWAGYGGYQGYKRYAIGVVAPAVAWSTMLMPIEGALITQFLGFVALYYVDVRATVRGWTPSWYRTYRFVLTAIVGASIVLTLIGRGELPDHIPGSADRAKVFQEGSEERLSHDEEARANKQKKKDAAGSDNRAGEEKEDKTR